MFKATPEWSEDELALLNVYIAELPQWTSSAAHHNGPPTDKDARKAFLTAEITDFLANRRAREANYMTPKEIGAAEDRGFLLRRAFIDGLAYFRLEKIGTRRGHHILAVYSNQCCFSLNQKGCITVSAHRMAKLLGVGEKTIREDLQVLVEHKLLGCQRDASGDARYWPIINRAYAGQNVHPAWWLDATSTPSKERGRPKNPGPLTENSGPLRRPDDFSGNFYDDKEKRGPTAADTTFQKEHAHPVIEVGDLVQWTSAGVDQFGELAMIRALSPCGKWAFVEGSETGIPVAELTKHTGNSAKGREGAYAASVWV